MPQARRCRANGGAEPIYRAFFTRLGELGKQHCKGGAGEP
jgi:hypothetical protein